MKTIIVATVILMLLTNSPFAIINDPIEEITDPCNDVIEMSFYGDNITYTDEKPNLDIKKITYCKEDQSSNVTITLEVKGEIENENDIDLYNYSNSSGKVTAYLTYLETTNNTYEISYIDEELDIYNTDLEGEFTVNNDELIIKFNLLDKSEKFVSFYGYSISVDLSDLLHPVHIDIAPNEAIFMPIIDAPSTAAVGEEIEFNGDVIDLFGYGFSLDEIINYLSLNPFIWEIFSMPIFPKYKI